MKKGAAKCLENSLNIPFWLSFHHSILVFYHLFTGINIPFLFTWMDDFLQNCTDLIHHPNWIELAMCLLSPFNILSARILLIRFHNKDLFCKYFVNYVCLLLGFKPLESGNICILFILFPRVCDSKLVIKTFCE